jgi:hypothetical protein
VKVSRFGDWRLEGVSGLQREVEMDGVGLQSQKLAGFQNLLFRIQWILIASSEK